MLAELRDPLPVLLPTIGQHLLQKADPGLPDAGLAACKKKSAYPK